jgi:uncharacterized paraquat-inducible protein A
MIENDLDDALIHGRQTIKQTNSNQPKRLEGTDVPRMCAGCATNAYQAGTLACRTCTSPVHAILVVSVLVEAELVVTGLVKTFPAGRHKRQKGEHLEIC